MTLEVIVFGTLAALAANLPFLSDKLFGVVVRPQGKGFSWRLLEWLLLYLLLGAIAWWLEGRHSPVHPQKWPFYATTLCLFMVFSWPGFVWRYFWRRPGV